MGWEKFGLKSTVKKAKRIGKKFDHGVKIGVKKVHQYAPQIDKGLAAAEEVTAAATLVPALTPYAAAATAGLAAARVGVRAADKGASSIEKNRKKLKKAGKAFV